MRVALDRPYPPAIAARLRDLRHDSLGLAERPDLAGLEDAALAEALAREGRILVTQNAADWLALRDVLPGLVLVDRHRYPRTPLASDKLVLALDALIGRMRGEEGPPRGRVWLEPPEGCPFWPAAG